MIKKEIVKDMKNPYPCSINYNKIDKNASVEQKIE